MLTRRTVIKGFIGAAATLLFVKQAHAEKTDEEEVAGITELPCSGCQERETTRPTQDVLSRFYEGVTGEEAPEGLYRMTTTHADAGSYYVAYFQWRPQRYFVTNYRYVGITLDGETFYSSTILQIPDYQLHKYETELEEFKKSHREEALRNISREWRENTPLAYTRYLQEVPMSSYVNLIHEAHKGEELFSKQIEPLSPQSIGSYTLSGFEDFLRARDADFKEWVEAQNTIKHPLLTTT